MKKIMEKLRKRDEGFTYVETIVCMLIILILVLAIAVSSIKYVDQAKITRVRSDMDGFKKALDSYYMDCGAYPSKAQGLNALWEKPYLYPVPAAWDGPYLESEIPLDPWGNEYIYNVPGTNNLPYEIISFGSDGTEGGEKTAADIISWKRRK